MDVSTREPRWINLAKENWAGTKAVLMIHHETKTCVHAWMNCDIENVMDQPVPEWMEHYSEYVDIRDIVSTHPEDYILVEAECNGKSIDT